jgi:ABC-type nitrate/sulfonate/bicarbonate transport system substrate-binding protein
MDIWAGMALQPEVATKLAAQGVTPKSNWKDKVRALKGRRVFGNSAGGPAEIRLRQLFAASGVDVEKDINFQPGTPESGNAAWRSKQLDTFTCCEPATFQLVPDAVVWLTPGEIDLPIKGAGEILATTESFVEKNPETLRRIIQTQKDMKAMILAAKPGTKEREQILGALGAQYPQVPADLIAKSWDTGYTTFDVDNEMTRQVVQDTIDGYNEGAKDKVNLKVEDLAAKGFLKN